jgi:PKD repeat protein
MSQLLIAKLTMRVLNYTYYLIFACLTGLGALSTSAQSCEVSASFSTTNNNLTVSFQDLSVSEDCQIVAWSWNLGDGTTSTIQNPTHTYPFSNGFHVCLTISVMRLDNNISEHVICEEVFVEIGLPCALNADFEVSTDNSGTVLLMENCSVGFFTSVDEFQWDLGDGTTDDGDLVAHTYSEPGTYEICLVAHASAGDNSCQNTQCILVEVAIAMPVVTVGFDVKMADNCRVIPKVTTLPVANVEVLEYRWELSDGRVFFGDQPDIDFDENGEIEICLIEECTAFGQEVEYASCQIITIACEESENISAPSFDLAFDAVVDSKDSKLDIKRIENQIQLRSLTDEVVQVEMYDISGRLFYALQLPASATINVPLQHRGLVIVHAKNKDGLLAVYRTINL